MDLISVIVPVYRVEPYLDRCVQSIVDQTYTNLEIILVDDGSPDECPRMCDAWAKRDGRIRVIHQENGGLSAARNAGMRAATGDYIAFVDSDDWLSRGFIENLHAAADKHDCEAAGCLFRMDNQKAQNGLQESTKILRIVDRVTAVGDLIEDRIGQMVWNKLYRRELIADIPFEEGKLHEDEFWSYQVLGRIHRYAEIDYVGYHYFQRPDSIMGKAYVLNRLDALEAKIDRQIYLQKNLPELDDRGQINLFFTCLYHGQMALKYLQGAQQQKALDRLRETCRAWRLTDAQKRTLKPTHRIWVEMAGCSLVWTCRIRNLLSIGL